MFIIKNLVTSQRLEITTSQFDCDKFLLKILYGILYIKCIQAVYIRIL